MTNQPSSEPERELHAQSSPAMSSESAGIASPTLGNVGPGTPRRKHRYVVALALLAAAAAAYLFLQPRTASAPRTSDSTDLPRSPTPAIQPN